MYIYGGNLTTRDDVIKIICDGIKDDLRKEFHEELKQLIDKFQSTGAAKIAVALDSIAVKLSTNLHTASIDVIISDIRKEQEYAGK